MTPTTDLFLKKLEDVGPDRLAYLTDFDGTGADFYDDPAQAAPCPGFVEGMTALHAALSGRAGIITGRDFDFIDTRIFPDILLPMSGEHNSRIRYETGGPIIDLVMPPDWQRIDAEMQRFLQENNAAEHGAFSELKTYSRILHWRPVPEAFREQIQSSFLKLAETLVANHNRALDVEALTLKNISLGAEIGPAIAHKGYGVENLVNYWQKRDGGLIIPGVGGDTEPDLKAFDAAKKLGGFAVGVGPNPEIKKAADIHFETPGEYAEALRLAGAMQAHRRPQKNYIPPPPDLHS